MQSRPLFEFCGIPASRVLLLRQHSTRIFDRDEQEELEPSTPTGTRVAVCTKARARHRGPDEHFAENGGSCRQIRAVTEHIGIIVAMSMASGGQHRSLRCLQRHKDALICI